MPVCSKTLRIFSIQTSASLRLRAKKVRLDGDFGHGTAHAGVGFDALVAAVQEILGQGDGSGLEEEDGRGATEGEVAFFLAFFDGRVSGVGLDDGADAGGTDFEHQHLAAMLGLDLANGAFVLPKVTEVLT